VNPCVMKNSHSDLQLKANRKYSKTKKAGHLARLFKSIY
jgi:hypothetical protein